MKNSAAILCLLAAACSADGGSGRVSGGATSPKGGPGDACMQDADCATGMCISDSVYAYQPTSAAGGICSDTAPACIERIGNACGAYTSVYCVWISYCLPEFFEMHYGTVEQCIEDDCTRISMKTNAECRRLTEAYARGYEYMPGDIPCE